MTEPARLAHLDEAGHGHMVDVSGKATTVRRAIARCTVETVADVSEALAPTPGSPDLVEVARVAAIGGAKQTWDLIPLCHPIRLTDVSVEIVPGDGQIGIEVTAVAVEKTGVEMEALTACACAALALVESLRTVDPHCSIEGLVLWRKEGGRSGTWVRGDPWPQ